MPLLERREFEHRGSAMLRLWQTVIGGTDVG
jgi:hypothetical protein